MLSSLAAGLSLETLTYLGIFQAFVDPPLVLTMGRIEVVLDAVVRATWELFGYVSPLVPQLLVQAEDLLLLFVVDRVLLNVRVKVVVPSETIGIRSDCW